MDVSRNHWYLTLLTRNDLAWTRRMVCNVLEMATDKQQAQYEGGYNRDRKEKGKLSNATHDRYSPSLPFYLIFKVVWQMFPPKGELWKEQPRSQGFFAGMVLLVGWRWAGSQRWSLAVNDPQSANGPQIGPEMMSINVMEKNRNGVDSIRSRLIYGEDTKSSLTKEAIKTGTHTLCQITKLKWKYTSNFWATRKWKELFTMHLLRVLKI